MPPLLMFIVSHRISVSHDRHVLALPLDNRHIRLYDLAGNRVAHLPHRNRMVRKNKYRQIDKTETVEQS